MSKTNTLRVTEFKGLNKATNPHNIGDAELVVLDNMFVTKNRGLESRKGYRRVGDVGSGYWLKSMFTTAWASDDDRLYYVGNGYLGKIDADGTDHYVTKIDSWGKTAQFNRYRDKVLFLNEGSYLRWFNVDEELELVQYPALRAADDYGSNIVNALGGGLKVDSHYQYCISLVLGDDYLDGEGPASRQASYTPFSTHYRGATGATGVDADDLTLVGDNLTFSGTLSGFNVGRIKFYRRKLQWVDGDATEIDSWVLIDIANINLDDAAESVTFINSDYGVITGIGGIWYPDIDLLTLILDFTDTGLESDGETEHYIAESPYEEHEVINPRARHMARLHNRIFLASIVGTGQPQDVKRVYYSYRGKLQGIPGFEIDGFVWPDPMLIFPLVNNHFACDLEDVEDPITAITSFHDSVIVFTERCMFLWREGMFDPVKISNDIGCISKRSLVEFEGKLIWLAHSGIFMYDGSKVENITFDKMQPYIDDLPKQYASYTKACVFDRKYFIAGPWEGGTLANIVLVYDFDMKAWHTREYQIYCEETAYIDVLYTDRDGATDTLYAGIKNKSGACMIVELETGYLDQQNPGSGEDALTIDVSIKTKYYSFKAPDIEKTYRNLLLDADNYFEDITLAVWIDNLDTAKETFTHRNNEDGFLLGSATHGVLGTNSLKTTSDEIFAFSLPRGLIGSRIQYSADLVANNTPLYIHMLGFDWTPKRKLKRKYGA